MYKNSMSCTAKTKINALYILNFIVKYAMPQLQRKGKWGWGHN